MVVGLCFGTYPVADQCQLSRSFPTLFHTLPFELLVHLVRVPVRFVSALRLWLHGQGMVGLVASVSYSAFVQLQRGLAFLTPGFALLCWLRMQHSVSPPEWPLAEDRVHPHLLRVAVQCFWLSFFQLMTNSSYECSSSEASLKLMARLAFEVVVEIF